MPQLGGCGQLLDAANIAQIELRLAYYALKVC